VPALPHSSEAASLRDSSYPAAEESVKRSSEWFAAINTQASATVWVIYLSSFTPLLVLSSPLICSLHRLFSLLAYNNTMVSGLYWALPLVAVLAVIATPVSVPPSRILPDAQLYTLRANW
jgi:hypothetical protein